MKTLFYKNKFLVFLAIASYLYIPTVYAESIRDKPHFEITASSINASVNEPDQVWDFSSLYLYRKNDYGTFGGIINYASRLNKTATQGMAVLMPKVNDDIWLDLRYGYANTPELIPDQTYKFEVYKNISKTVVVSFGDTYKRITSTYFNTYTLSIGKYWGYYYFAFRPYYFVPKAGPRSALFRFEAKRYWDNPDKNFGFAFATGTSPDLFDLLTVQFFKVQNNIFLVEGQQPLNDAWSFLYGAGYETQLFPSGFIRRLPFINLGIKARMA